MNMMNKQTFMRNNCTNMS